MNFNSYRLRLSRIFSLLSTIPVSELAIIIGIVLQVAVGVFIDSPSPILLLLPIFSTVTTYYAVRKLPATSIIITNHQDNEM